ncbi:glutaredoxin family protein [Methanobacterium oryzae]|uniref:glutaredoxin family protein n=1 Tax=Methanobacterium oryzae TaxID=69540 RepID=UPI003D1A5492
MKNVSIYTLSTCPWCKKAKEFFREHKIPFEYIIYDLASLDERERIIKEMYKYEANGFLFVKIGDEVVVGYNPEKYSEIMELKS